MSLAKVALSLLSVLVACSASASVTPQKPWEVCAKLTPDEAKDKCYQIVDRKRYFDERAVGECYLYNNSWHAIDCMRAIEGHHFTCAAVDRCDALTDDVATTRCLATVAGHYFDQAAGVACDRINDENLKVECWDAIRDKHFREWQVKRCDGYETGEGTIRCFREMNH